MRAYSTDLRKKIIEEIESKKKTQREIAENFRVSLAFVEKLWRRYRTKGNYEALPHGGGKKRSLRECEAAIREQLKEQPDLTLEELSEKIEQAKGVKSSKSMMCRELKRLALPVKKNRSKTLKERPKESKH